MLGGREEEVELVKVDVEQAPQLATEYGVRTTYIIIVNSKRPAQKFTISGRFIITGVDTLI